MLSHLSLEPVDFKLKVITGENVIIIGQVLVQIIHNGKKVKLLLIILNSKTRFIPLLGRNWLISFNQNWKSVIDSQVMLTKSKNINVKSLDHLKNETSQINQAGDIDKHKLISLIKTKFAIIFSGDSHISIKNFKADIKVKENVNPIFHRAYQMPFALKAKVESELSKLVKDGILTKVNFSGLVPL